MSGFVEEWLSSEIFMPHGHCYLWKPALVWLEVLTNASIGLAYVAITIALLILVRRVRNLPFHWMYLCFGAFIVACGVTHFFDVVVIWKPLYWLDAGIRGITAVASVGTAVLLPRLLPKIKELSEASARVQDQGIQLAQANAELAQANAELAKARDDLETRVKDRTAELVGITANLEAEIAERKRAEEGLRHWERIFQHATWGVALAGIRDVRFRAVNPAYARMHGYTVEELVDAPVSTLWAEETKADMERHAAETHTHGTLVAETVHLCKDGTRLPVEVIATTIKDANGDTAWFVANVQDITERKRMQRARDRALELEVENRRFEEANRLKSEFLANMSHELRTPLNSIIGFAELLHDEEVGAVTDKQKEFLGDILVGGRHLLRLINDVLDLAKVEAGKMEFHPEPVDLEPLVTRLTHSLRSTVLDKHLQITVSVAPGLSDVVLDPGRFKQVLYNYVSNALKFTPAGGQVTVRVTPEGAEQFRLEVEDTGPGISEENQRHLFVAFQQLDPGAGKLHSGTGLGLALTKRLAEAQGGTVGIRPGAKQGSVFFAVLPRRPANSGEPIGHRADVHQATTVLVVENDRGDQEVLSRILKEAGYEVDVVSTCADALAAWRRKAYDAVTLGLLLPDGGDSQTLLQNIRADVRRPDVPVIAMTMVGDSSAATGYAVNDILAKPVDSEALLAALERAGVPRTRDRPVLVVDDDVGSLKLMEIALAKLGYQALCFSRAIDALRAVQEVKPLAVVLDIMMPEMNGLAFLDRFRASPENRRIPVMIWTVKDLSVDERRGLHDAVDAVVQKGVGDGSRLSAALQSFLPAKGSGTERAP